ncbi:endonuclease III [Candidatus Mancarchaeum acidiphilum]|uniref:Endonuclease III n=1 Tax=Candidatus Mancarchaeum acidiphilum TaxID=1920749 RepID=A0A218NNR5_9ARCH|nr:endonuclease III [Candidatus Mancarchaeum acidiphilum]ASI14102.1 endonuclease III [Candidatus Mancarchaeum acidiphilum]
MKVKSRRFIGLVIKRLKAAYPDQMHTQLEYSNKWELLIAVILSAQTTDVSVNKVTKKLFANFPGPEDLLDLKPDDLYPYIRSIGLYRGKSKRLIEAAKMLVSQFDSKVPTNTKDLMKIPGVGRKVANVVLSEGFGINEGIAIDTHCITVSNRLGLANTHNPEVIERVLIKITPKDEWNNISHLFIALGRDTCQARKKICERCVLNDICISSTVKNDTYKNRNIHNI